MVRNFVRMVALAALAASAVPAAAQGTSDSYKFLKAVREGKGEVVDEMVSTPGFQINTKERATGDGALHILAGKRNLNWMSFLIGKGARPDLQNQLGMTPLAIAAQLGWIEGARLLLDRRASVDLANSRGETPLIFAVQRRDVELVRLLLARGANPKRADRVAGYSALDYAKRDARAGAIVKLLEAPAASAAVQGPKL